MQTLGIGAQERWIAVNVKCYFEDMFVKNGVLNNMYVLALYLVDMIRDGLPTDRKPFF